MIISFGNLCFGSNNCLLICSYLLKDGRENLIENSGHHYWLVNLKKKFLFNIIKLKRIDQNLGNVIRFLQIVFIYVSRLEKIRLEILFQKKIEEKRTKTKKRSKKERKKTKKFQIQIFFDLDRL